MTITNDLAVFAGGTGVAASVSGCGTGGDSGGSSFFGVIGSRIAQVVVTPFDVALPLNWVEVLDTVTAEGYYWDGTQALQIPVPIPNQVANSAGPAS